MLEQEQEYLRIGKADLARRVERTLQPIGIADWQRKPQYYFIWLQWSRRYRVSFEKIVSMTVTEARRWFNKTGPSLGIHPATLTGPKMAAWLEEQFAGKKNASGTSPVAYTALGSIIDPVKYGEDMEKLRRSRSRHQSALRPYRGSVKWQPPRRWDDPMLKLFGYHE